MIEIRRSLNFACRALSCESLLKTVRARQALHPAVPPLQRLQKTKDTCRPKLPFHVHNRVFYFSASLIVRNTRGVHVQIRALDLHMLDYLVCGFCWDTDQKSLVDPQRPKTNGLAKYIGRQEAGCSRSDMELLTNQRCRISQHGMSLL